MKGYLNLEHILNNEQKQHRLPGTVIIVTPCKNRSYHLISSQTFSKNEDICIQNSDNGESDVIIDQSYYKNKLESLLNFKTEFGKCCICLFCYQTISNWLEIFVISNSMS